MWNVINKLQCAEYLGVDERTITRWQNRSHDPLPIVSKGKGGRASEYDINDLRDWDIRQVKSKFITGDNGEVIDYEKERAALTKAQKEGQEIRNQIALGKIAPVEVLEFAVGKLAAECAGIIDSLPLNMKRKHPELTSQQLESVKRECVKAMNTMARGGNALESAINDYIQSLDSLPILANLTNGKAS